MARRGFLRERGSKRETRDGIASPPGAAEQVSTRMGTPFHLSRGGPSLRGSVSCHVRLSRVVQNRGRWIQREAPKAEAPLATDAARSLHDAHVGGATCEIDQ